MMRHLRPPDIVGLALVAAACTGLAAALIVTYADVDSAAFGVGVLLTGGALVVTVGIVIAAGVLAVVRRPSPPRASSEMGRLLDRAERRRGER